MKCPWYNDGMCMFDDDESECIEEYKIYKCIDNPNRMTYGPALETMKKNKKEVIK